MTSSSTPLLSALAQIQDFEYLYASNTNVSNFVSVKLSGSNNYHVWRSQVLCVLDSCNMGGIVDPTFVRPRNSSTDIMRQYDSLARGWILGSLSDGVLADVHHLNSAKGVWEKLKSIYDPDFPSQEGNPGDTLEGSSGKDTKLKAKLEGNPGDTLEGSSGKDTKLKAKLEETKTAEEGANSVEIKILPTENEDTQNTEEENEQKKKLRAATIKGDWFEVESILKKNEKLATKAISRDGSTVLDIAVGTSNNEIVEKVIPYIKDKEQVLKGRESDGSTSLHIAAIVGNKYAAEHLVKINPEFLQIKDHSGDDPLKKAYENMHLDTIVYLLEAVKTDSQPDPGYHIAVDLLVHAISAKQYSLALKLVDLYPDATSKTDDVLMAITQTFPREPYYWETLIYPPPVADTVKFLGEGVLASLQLFLFPAFLIYLFAKDKINPILIGVAFAFSLLLVPITLLLSVCDFILTVFCSFLVPYALLWKGAKILPFTPISHIEHKKKEWDEAIKVLELVCDKIHKSEYSGTHHPHYTRPILEAASRNAYKVIDEILYRSPEAIQCTDKNGYDIIQLAIMNRSEKIYNLIYDIGERKIVYRTYKDSSENNILHLAGRLAPSNVLNQTTGAALQLQRELQWREDVKKFIFPTYITQENIFKETPDMVFTREHENLVKEGEKWMKTTAESCSITAALIITIIFAAAITVPGGSHQETGIPLFRKRGSFIIFAISNAISLFASTTALIVFLSILTARFSENDFLVSLPRRLFIGLFSLLLSTTTMMIAFSAILFLVFGDEKLWMLAPICVLAFVPIAFFVGLQFPLMVDLFRSTSIRIFGKQRKSNARRFSGDDIRLSFGVNFIRNMGGVATGEKKGLGKQMEDIFSATKKTTRSS